jgi:hypothetical protein
MQALHYWDVDILGTSDDHKASAIWNTLAGMWKNDIGEQLIRFVEKYAVYQGSVNEHFKITDHENANIWQNAK